MENLLSITVILWESDRGLLCLVAFPGSNDKEMWLVDFEPQILLTVNFPWIFSALTVEMQAQGYVFYSALRQFSKSFDFETVLSGG
jgi:hypothetical protein